MDDTKDTPMTKSEAQIKLANFYAKSMFFLNDAEAEKNAQDMTDYVRATFPKEAKEMEAKALNFALGHKE